MKQISSTHSVINYIYTLARSKDEADFTKYHSQGFKKIMEDLKDIVSQQEIDDTVEEAIESLEKDYPGISIIDMPQPAKRLKLLYVLSQKFEIVS